MLKPPLSLLSDDLFFQIVEHVANLQYMIIENLRNDRVFTRFCQAYIFKDLRLGSGDSGTKKSISKKLTKIGKILNNEPSFANRVRSVRLMISHKQNAWFFIDPTFVNIVQLIGKSLVPPHTLDLSGAERSFIFEDPIRVAGQLMKTFFSQTLTVLHLTDCKNVPLTLFLVCSRLRDVLLDDVEVMKDSYDKYPDEQCSSRELPALDRLNYRISESLVKQMITPPPRFHKAVILWSKLRVLKLSPLEKEDMVCLQPILDSACNTLEELYLTNPRMSGNDKLFTDFVNLKDLSCLRVFAVYAIIKCSARQSTVLHDINLILSTIPTSNKIMTLSFELIIFGKRPFCSCVGGDWAGLCNEVIRISAGKPLNMILNVSVFPPNFEYPPPGQDKLHERILEKIRSLLDYPNIVTKI